uniref:TAFH domain-containing protein n=1 Tax=Myripristis murdjan TaxID=586833 RepID=A0A668A0N2_9TELE
MTSDSFPQCLVTRRRTMAGASDPLEDMLFSEVDEKAVSDLVGSLESQLAGQSNPAGKADDSRGAGSVTTANHHLGKTLPAPVGTTTLEQQQQGRRNNKAEMRQETNSKEISSDKTVTSLSPGCTPISTAVAAVRGSKVTPGSGEASAEANPPRKRISTPRRSASARIKSLNGGSVTTRRNSSSAAVTDSVSSVDSSATIPNSTRAVTSSINTTTFTLSNASISAGQSAIALDRGTPTIALHRLPNHIVASIAQNGNGTTVSALVQQGARIGPITSTASQVNHSKAITNTGASKTDDSHSKTVMSGQSGNINSVINTVSSTPAAPSPTPAVATSAQSQPRPGLSAPQRIVAPQLIVRPPQQQTTIQLPPGFTIPQGMVLVRTELGQLVMVPQQALAQAQAQAQAQNNISPRPATPTTGATFRVTTPQSPVTSQTTRQCPLTPAKMVPSPSPTPSSPGECVLFCVLWQEMQENVKKCKNFLATLIKLASHNSPSPETSKNVKALVQDLLDAKIEPEEFTSRLQSELKSSPQPYLVPFLKKSLPALRLSLLNSQQSLTQPPQQGVKPVPSGTPPAIVPGPTVRVRHPNSVSTTTGASPLPAGTLGHAGIKRAGAAGGQVRMPVVITQSVRAQAAIQAGKSPVGLAVQISGNQKNKLNDPGGGSFRDDDDINDVASMAGVNLNEESARILATNSELVGTQIRSCKDEAFLHPGLLHRRILETAKKFGVTEVPMEAVTFISHATQSRLRTVVEKVSTIAQHRLDSCKDDECYEQSADVRSQLRFFEQLERIEKQRKDEQEREILLKAAKSRSRQEDPEQARLKQKAKEMQQQELAQMRQRDANLTALAAIGPRKKRKMDSPGVSGSTASSPASSSAPSTSSRQYARQRITRVNLRDFIFYMEQERETAHSLLLYRALLK